MISCVAPGHRNAVRLEARTTDLLPAAMDRDDALAAENAVLKDLIRRLDQDKENLKTDRDLWRTQAERLALAPRDVLGPYRDDDERRLWARETTHMTHTMNMNGSDTQGKRMKVCDPMAGQFRGGQRGRNPVEPGKGRALGAEC